MFLSVVTKHDFSYWLVRGSTEGVFLLGSALIALFVVVVLWSMS